MSVTYSQYIANCITQELQPKADELDIEFRIKHTSKTHGDDVLVRVKSDGNVPPFIINAFTKHAGEVIVPHWSNGVRYTYPERL